MGHMTTVENFTTKRFGAVRPSSAPPHTLTETGDALEALLRPARTLARGEHLFHAAERASALYYIESGSVEIYAVTAGGGEQVVGFHFAGDLVGLDALGASHHACSAMALENTSARALPVSVLGERFLRDPILQHRFFRLASQRIAQLQEQMLVLGKKSAPERLATFLLDLLARQRLRGERGGELHLSMSRYAIGCYLGLAHETVSRLLQQFRDDGLIAVCGRHVHILDHDGLRELAGVSAAAGWLDRGHA